ncbi:unnamed protein product [Rotaria sordida]|uniref:MAM domain-containing protein n=1 Tax=Rotaria sordida TaxID=392033 RepID=A0A819HTK3_9BILA|nr:unnamed protein product [Rotaria sordida]
MWYYTPRISLPFSIQVVQGDDELLTRVIASIPGKDPSINDWTQVNVLLPAEKIKIYIRLNVSVGPLAFDDFSVDYCDKPRPSPPDTLFVCDFESSCTDKFISLPEYIYQWSVIQADDAVKQQDKAPPIDYTYDYSDSGDGAYALDNIEITSCDYPTSSLTPYDSFLSFSCNFDNQTMCDMENGDRFTTPKFNFTLMTGDTIPNRNLGPTRDHTSNSSSGGFLYWNRQLPFIPGDNGMITTSKSIEQNTGMCIRFAYYVKSLAVNKNATNLMLSTGGCYGATRWYVSMDDSQGWQVVKVPVLQFACAETFYFSVSQDEPIEVSVAFDDIEIAQCSSFNPSTTTTTATTTSTTQSTSTTTVPTTTTTSTTQSTSTTTVSTTTTTSTTQSTSTTTVPTTTTTSTTQSTSTTTVPPTTTTSTTQSTLTTTVPTTATSSSSSSSTSELTSEFTTTTETTATSSQLSSTTSQTSHGQRLEYTYPFVLVILLFQLRYV